MRWREHALLGLLASTLTAIPAQACSVRSGYRVPTTTELVRRADIVLLATVVAGKVDATEYRPVYLRPKRLLKGVVVPPLLKLDEAVISTPSVRTVPSDPLNVTDAHPDAFSGSCNRKVFDEGMMLVIFVKRQDGKFVIQAPPFARALEDVPSQKALWVTTVKREIQLAAQPSSRRYNEKGIKPIGSTGSKHRHEPTPRPGLIQSD